MKKIFLILFIILSVSVSANVHLNKTTSRYSFSKTIEKIKQQIDKMNLKLIAEVPHSKAAEKSDLKLNNSHLLIFGNPKVGSLLMQSDIEVGIELPLKILIYQNEEGDIIVAFKSPKKLLRNYKLEDKKEILNKMEIAMQKIVKVVH
jgi:uncharacterized protein (DUF302 family)